MAQVTFLLFLGLGTWGLWALIRWDRRNRWIYAAMANVCFFGLFTAGLWAPTAIRSSHPSAVEANRVASTPRHATPPDSTLLDSTRLASTALNATLPPFSFDSRWGAKREAEYTERYRQVFEEIGPPPTPDAVPKLGYVGKNGKRTSSAWVTRPDGSEENNLVRSVR